MIANGLFHDFAIVPAVAEIERYGITVVPNFLLDDVRGDLLCELEASPWIKAPEYKGQRMVRQDFMAVVQFRENGLFAFMQRELEQFLNKKLARCKPNPLSEPLCFNNIVAQRYMPNSAGIQPHRDGPRFINLIALIVLEGEGRFGICEDNDGGGMIPISNEPGSLLLMRGFGFLDSQEQPIHCVDRIKERRTTFGLRHKVR
jgi:hypothetical protein